MKNSLSLKEILHVNQSKYSIRFHFIIVNFVVNITYVKLYTVFACGQTSHFTYVYRYYGLLLEPMHYYFYTI